MVPVPVPFFINCLKYCTFCPHYCLKNEGFLKNIYQYQQLKYQCEKRAIFWHRPQKNHHRPSWGPAKNHPTLLFPKNQRIMGVPPLWRSVTWRLKWAQKLCRNERQEGRERFCGRVLLFGKHFGTGNLPPKKVTVPKKRLCDHTQEFFRIFKLKKWREKV